MNTDTKPTGKTIHHGRNVKRLRELLDIKQEILAESIGVSQQTVSRFETQEVLEDEILNKFAIVMHIPVEALKNMNEESTYSYINTFYDSSINQGVSTQYNFNPIEKIVELYNEKVELYERILKAEQEKNATLEKQLAQKNK